MRKLNASEHGSTYRGGRIVTTSTITISNIASFRKTQECVAYASNLGTMLEDTKRRLSYNFLFVCFYYDCTCVQQKKAMLTAKVISAYLTMSC